MFYQGRRSWGQSFPLVRQAFLQAEGLPFDGIPSEGDIQQAFETENACFARDEGDIYTPAITLWAFLSQVLHAQRLRSCAAAVSIRAWLAQALPLSHRRSSFPSLRLAKEILLVPLSARVIPRLPNSLPAGRRSRCAPANIRCQHLTETALVPLIILAVSSSCSVLDPSARVSLSSQPLSRVTLKVVDSAIRGCHLSFPRMSPFFGAR